MTSPGTSRRPRGAGNRSGATPGGAGRVRRDGDTRDVEQAAILEADDDAMDELQRQTFSVLTAPSWSHGIRPAVDITLLARFYARSADHPVTIARRVVYGVTGRLPKSMPGSRTVRPLPPPRDGSSVLPNTPHPVHQAPRAMHCTRVLTTLCVQDRTLGRLHARAEAHQTLRSCGQARTPTRRRAETPTGHRRRPGRHPRPDCRAGYHQLDANGRTRETELS